jgi:large subunit ribosomal protein L2
MSWVQVPLSVKKKNKKMALREYPAGSPGQRHQIRVIRKNNSQIDRLSRLIIGSKANSGRNNKGRITVRGLGGGNKKNYRQIDLKREIEVPGKITGIEYDPNRSANIASILYRGVNDLGITINKVAYIIATKGLTIGQTIVSGMKAEHIEGNSLPISKINVGTQICLIETKVGKGATLCRSAGTSARIVKKDTKTGYGVIALKSGVFKSIPLNCIATIGTVGNDEHSNEQLGKAGVSR